MKKVFFFWVVLLIGLNSIFAKSFSSVNSDGKTIYYEVINHNNREVKVSMGHSWFSEYSGHINIPEYVMHEGIQYHVTRLDSRAFYGSSVTSVVLPSSITKLYDGGDELDEGIDYYYYGTFAYCKSLTSITLPSTLTYIGDYAFLGCCALTSITIPSNVTYIGNFAFSECSNLNTVSIGSSVTFINSTAFDLDSNIHTIYWDVPRLYQTEIFQNKTSIEVAIFGSSVRRIPSGIFKGCTSLNSISMSNSVEEIGSYAFYGANITRVAISSSVTSIEESAFGECKGLLYVSLPDSLKYLGGFDNTHLNEIYIPKSVVSIDNKAFANTNLSRVVIPSAVKKIGDSAFFNTHISSIGIPDLVDTIGDHAFSYTNISSVEIPNSVKYLSGFDYTNISSIQIPNSVETIGEDAFSNTSIASVILPQSVKVIKKSAFGNTLIDTITIPNSVISLSGFDNTLLRTIDIPSSVTIIDDYAFGGCSRLSLFTIPDSVVRIGDSAFKDCTSITSIVIPKGLRKIGSAAFVNDFNLHTLYWNATHVEDIKEYELDNKSIGGPFSRTAIENVIFGDSIRFIPKNLFRDCQALVSVAIPNSVVSIRENAFYNCTSLTSVILEDGIDTIADGSFSYTALASIEIPQSVKYLGGFANTNIRSINIPNKVKAIGDSSFYKCKLLATLVIGDSVESIGESAFDSCILLSTITLPIELKEIKKNAFKDINNIDTIYWNSKKISDYYNSPFQNTLIKNVIFGNRVRIIPDYAFKGITSIETVVIGDSVITIGDKAFMGCNLLGCLTIPESVWRIGYSAFANNINMHTIHWNAIDASCSEYYPPFENNPIQTIIFGDNSQSVPDRVFENFIMLDSLVLGKSISSIGDDAFSNDSNLHTLYWNAQNITDIDLNLSFANVQIQKVLFGDSVVTIPNNMLHGFASVDSIYIGANVTSIGAKAFKGTSIKNIKIPNSVNAIGYKTFANCSMLDSVSIGTGINSIGDSAFVDCDKMVYLSVGAIEPPAIKMYTFRNVRHQIPVFVPCASINKYRNNLDWAYFTNMQCGNILSIEILSNNDEWGTVMGGGGYIHNSVATLCATANEGYHFVRWNDGSTINPRSITVTSDTSIMAIFAVNTYIVEVGSSDIEMGRVIGGGSYECMSEVTINAVANYGYHFTQWSDGNTENPRVMRLTQDTSMMAEFVRNTYTVVVESSDEVKGSVTEGGSYDYLSKITITATANYGYHFVRWSDGNTELLRELIVNRDSNLIAEFVENTYSMSVVSIDEDKGSVVGDGNYNYLTDVTIAAIAKYGYNFKQWSDGNTENPRTIRLTQDTNMIAQFDVDSYVVLVESSNIVMGGGMGSGSYDYMSEVIVTAVPNHGYYFKQWSDGNTENPRVIKLTQDTSITAQFAVNNYSVIIESSDSAMGNVMGSGEYNYMSEVTLNAIAKYGYHFSQWSDGNTENPRVINLTQDTSLTAEFVLNTYVVAVTSLDTIKGGAEGSGDYDYLSMVTISATANYGYHFSQWNDGNVENPRVINLTQDTNLTAEFELNTYIVDVTSLDTLKGGVEGSGDYDYLSMVTISAMANYGYHFSQWNDGNMENPRVINLTQDTSLTAEFELNTYAIVIESSDDSMGSTIGSGEYDYLHIVTIRAMANEGYQFVSWNDGNVDNPREISVTRDTIITAIFEEIPIPQYYITVLSSNEEWGSVSGTGYYEEGTSTIISAVAKDGYHFVNWNDGSSVNPREVLVIEDATYIATFISNENEEIEDVDRLAGVKVYPNPTNGILMIDGEGVERMEVMNMVGVKVMEIEGKSQIDLSGLVSGVYMLRIETDKGEIVCRVVKR